MNSSRTVSSPYSLESQVECASGPGGDGGMGQRTCRHNRLTFSGALPFGTCIQVSKVKLSLS